jgi:hypothetical protein
MMNGKRNSTRERCVSGRMRVCIAPARQPGPVSVASNGRHDWKGDTNFSNSLSIAHALRVTLYSRLWILSWLSLWHISWLSLWHNGGRGSLHIIHGWINHVCATQFPSTPYAIVECLGLSIGYPYALSCSRLIEPPLSPTLTTLHRANFWVGGQGQLQPLDDNALPRMSPDVSSNIELGNSSCMDQNPPDGVEEV